MRTGWCVVTILVLAAPAVADKAKDALDCDRGDASACERACKAKDGIACTERGLVDPGKGKSWFETACNLGETFGCKLVAQLAEKAQPQDLPLARATYTKACDLGNDTACARIGRSREEKVKPASYPPRLVEAIRAACTGKHQPSCTELGALYITGRGVTKDESVGLTAFDTACAANELWACSNLGIQLSGKKETAQLGLESLEKACTGGIAHACFNLALRLWDSPHITNDKARAAQLLDMACTMGQVFACTSLGRIYIDGSGGFAKDRAKAEKLFSRACNAKSAGGCVELGRMNDGDHGPANYKVAIPAFTTACDRGSAAGCTGMGLVHHKGLGVPEDFVKARDFYERGCALEHGASCNNLGILSFEGKGGAKDEAKAIELYEKGCNLENGAACVNLAYRKDTRAPVQKGCDFDDPGSCKLLGNWLVHGTNGSADKPAGLVALDKGCRLGDKDACTEATNARK